MDEHTFSRGFSLLEDSIEKAALSDGEEVLDEYLRLRDISESERGDFAKVLITALAVSETLNSEGLEGMYYYIGGYATLFHIVNARGVEALTSWRDSHDLDIVTDNSRVKNTIRANFKTTEAKSYSICGKINLSIIFNYLNTPVNVDLYNTQGNHFKGLNLTEGIMDKAQTVEVLGGVRVKVPKIKHLLRMKLDVSRKIGDFPRDSDKSDICNLLGVLESYEGFSRKYPRISDKLEYLNKNVIENSERRYRALCDTLSLYIQGNLPHILSPPSDSFIDQILTNSGTFIRGDENSFIRGYNILLEEKICA